MRSLTFVRKSLQPAANASCLSLCRLLAVKATMMTGLLEQLFLKVVSVSSFTCLHDINRTAAENTDTVQASSRLISLVASNPFMTGN